MTIECKSFERGSQNTPFRASCQPTPIDPTEWEISQSLEILSAERLSVYKNSLQTDVRQQLPLWDHYLSLSLLALCLNTNTRPANCCEIQVLINLLILMWSTWLQIQIVFVFFFKHFHCFKFLPQFYLMTQITPSFENLKQTRWFLLYPDQSCKRKSLSFYYHTSEWYVCVHLCVLLRSEARKRGLRESFSLFF